MVSDEVRARGEMTASDALSSVHVSNSDIKEYYRENRDLFGYRTQANSHDLIKTERAISILKAQGPVGINP